MESGGSGLLSKLSDQERQHMVARAVVGVQSEVIEKHGYKGDAGFAQVERHPSEISTPSETPTKKKRKYIKKDPSEIPTIRDPYHQRPLP